MAYAGFRILFLLAACCAPFAAAASKVLDQGRIHADYHNGDFDKVIKVLEGFQKSGRDCSAAESLFLEKHLAVVYAANPGTRELGRYHMFRMLDLAPGADLLDMFVGEEVDGVFEKIRKEHSLRMAAKRTAKAAPAARTQPAAPVPAKAAWENLPASSLAKPAKSSWETLPASRPAFVKAAIAKPTVSASANQVAAPKPAAAPARTAASWDAIASAPSMRPESGRLASASAKSGSAKQNPRDGVSDATGASGGKPAGFHAGSAPAWKEPGLWIGGGAALAVVAFTLFYSGSSSETPDAKTYVVPASVAH